MKLPVHAKLGKYVGASALCAGRNLLVYIIILEAHAVVAVLSLRQHRKVIVGNLGYGISALVNAMPDLMGNAPPEVSAALVSALAVRRHRHGGYHACAGIPFNANVIAGGIHECPGEHPLVTDVQMALRYLVQRLFSACVQALVLIEQVHHAFHRIHGIQDLLRLLLHAAASRPIQNLLCRQGEHHGIQENVRSSQDTVLRIIIICHLAVPGACMEHLMLVGNLSHKCLQLHYINLGPCQPLLPVRHPVQIQPGNLHAAADAHRVPVSCVVPRILDIKRTAGFHARVGPYLGNRDLVGTHLQICDGLAHGTGFRVVLCRHQLKIRIFPGSFGVMPYVDNDFLLRRRGYAKRLPCVQPAEAPVHVTGADAAVDDYRII